MVDQYTKMVEIQCQYVDSCKSCIFDLENEKCLLMVDKNGEVKT